MQYISQNRLKNIIGIYVHVYSRGTSKHKRVCRILWRGVFANANEPVLDNVLDFAAVVIELMPTAQVDTKNGCNQCRGR